MLKISNIVGEALAHAEKLEQGQSEKEASNQASSQSFTSSIAEDMHKLAQDLRAQDRVQVSYSDVVDFIGRIAE